MNIFIVAFFAALAALAVGFVFYGLYYAKILNEKVAHARPDELFISLAAIYVACLAFVYVYQHFAVGSLSGVAKGASLGAIVGGGHSALPLIADNSYLQSRGPLVWTVTANWFFTFIIVGLVVGALAR